MASAISFEGSNHGFQLGENHGHVSVQFLQSEISLNEACLRDLRTTDPHDDKNRIEQTKGGLLKDSYRWILDNEQFQQWQRNYSSRLLWIKGNPGKGKTMLLCGIINELTRSVANTANLSYFFCQATDGRINTATAVLRGLIYSLVEKQRSLLSYVRSQYDQAGKQIFEDINAWHAVSRIFTNILKDPSMQDTYLIIDALDECKIGLPSLLDFIVQELSAYPHVKWIVSSRNWPGIEEKLDTAAQTVPISLELNETYVSEAVSNFIRHKVGQLAKTKKYDEKTRESIYHYFSLKSQGTFLWVALVCEELVGISRRNTLKKLKAFPPGLNALYGRMIDRIRALDEADAKLCMRVLAIISTAYRPLTLKELNVFLDEPEDDCVDDEDLSEIISRCGSFLIQCEETIYFVHQSAQDFLKALSDIFPKGIEAEHYTIFMRSFQFIFKTLQRDIYNIKAPGLPAEKVRQPSPNPLKVAQYACVYWVDHFQDGKCDKIADPNLHEGGCVDVFLRQKYLHWLEALSILGSVSYGITAMVKLDCLLQVKGESKALLRRVRDASRFIQYHRAAIESSPLQVYSSPLIFSPTQSLTRICYGEERPDWVLNDPVVEEDWSACLQSLEGHMGSIHSIAWSQDGTRLASASYDHTVRIWNPVTGQCASTLKGHIGSVNSIAWSPDGSQLASASDDKIIRNWDPATGQCVSILDGHMGSIHLIAWSIWDPATSQCVLTLEGYSDSVRSIVWSQDRTRLASASWDNTVKIWELVISQSALTLKGHSKSVNSIAWSQDGSRIASASDDKAVRIWDPATGQCISILEGHSDSVRSIAWSRDSSRLASASHDKTIRIWDPATGLCVLTLKGHSDWVNSIAWSQDSS
ncbi:hypothetical protein DTO002I6_9925 [Penicillium roqueforti]|nr:hypothetical protein DTO002I6_9925 [Penicillium roqueforti]